MIAAWGENRRYMMLTVPLREENSPIPLAGYVLAFLDG